MNKLFEFGVYTYTAEYSGSKYLHIGGKGYFSQPFFTLQHRQTLNAYIRRRRKVETKEY